MKSLISSTAFIAALAVFVPSAAAYTFGNTTVNPLYGPDFRHVFQGNVTAPAPADNALYIGEPERGVDRLRITERENILADLEQRAISLEKMRKMRSVPVSYDTQQRVYERLLRRVGNDAVDHYRSRTDNKDLTNYREVWRNGQLVRVPRLTPEDIHSAVDTYEHVRAIRTSTKDICNQFSGSRAATCRYQQRVNDQINN